MASITGYRTAQAEFFNFFGHRVYYALFNGSGLGALLAAFWSLENVTSILALVGVLLWVAGKRPSPPHRGAGLDLCVLLAFALPYFLIFGMYEKTGARIGLPLLPILASMAAFGLTRGLSLLPALRSSSLGAAALALIVLSVPSTAAWRFVSRRALPDTATRAARWMEANIDPSAHILLIPPLEIPRARGEEAMRKDANIGWKSPWRSYLGALAGQDLAMHRFDMHTWPMSKAAEMERATREASTYFKARDVQFVVLSVSRNERVRAYSEGLRSALRDLGWRVCSIPDEDYEALPLLGWGFEAKSGVNWT